MHSESTSPETRQARLGRRPTASGKPWRDLSREVAGCLLPFSLVLYLALQGGGYDEIVRTEVGVAAWWIVAVGAIFNLLPRTRITVAGWVLLGLLLAFTAWTSLGIGWSESTERSVTEAARAATYLAILTLGLVTGTRGGLRRTVYAVAFAIAAVAAVSLLSRFHPAWFPVSETSSGSRLSYPLNYWNGLAALMAMGIPLLVAISSMSRSRVLAGFAMAAVPLLALTGFYTLSRGGAVEVAVALSVLLAVYPQRLRLLAPIALGTAASVVLIAAADSKDALLRAAGGDIAAAQADEMLVITLIVCVCTGLAQVAITSALRDRLLPKLSISASSRRWVLGFLAAAVLAAGVGYDLPGVLSDGYQDFKKPASTEQDAPARFGSVSSSGRYQVWQSAIDANSTAPLIGIGPGTFEYWWAREKPISLFVRDAHSLYFETLGELGLIGFVLVVALIGSVLVVGGRHALGSHSERGALAAAATASSAAFATAAAVDWVWELAVLPAAFLLLGGAIVQSEGQRSRHGSRRVLEKEARIVLAAVALPLFVAMLIPLAGAKTLSESQQQAASGDLTAALQRARDAGSIEPYATTPKLQEALVLERLGDLDAAVEAARAATREEPVAWRNWLVLSRLEASAGNPKGALHAYREAQDLNPRSALFLR